ncbi:glycosyltransferase [Vibrio metschnikovii]|nr:glycosyltransferase [Vibrio metschnikovii]
MNIINVFIVNYNSIEDVKNQIKKLSVHEDIRIFVVDNSSEFGGYQKNNVTVLTEGKNLGYAGGNNLAFNHITGVDLSRCVLVLNPDVEIEVTAIRAMARFLLSNTDVGQVYCAAVNQDNKWLYGSIHMNGLDQVWAPKSSNTDFVSSWYAAGSAFMFIPQRIKQDYLFDDGYFLYWEEVELSIRIKKQGLRIEAYVAEPCIRKDNSHSSVINSIYYLVRNSFVLNRTHKIATRCEHLRYLVGVFKLSLILAFKTFSFKPLSNFIAGIKCAVKNKKGMRAFKR